MDTTEPGTASSRGAKVKGVWREIAIGVLSFTLGMGGVMFVAVKNNVTRQEMVEYTEKHGPWPRDRAMVMGLLTNEKNRRDLYEAKIERLTESVIRLESSMDRHSDILKAIEERMRRREEKDRNENNVNYRLHMPCCEDPPGYRLGGPGPISQWLYSR